MTLEGYYFDGKRSWILYKKKDGSIVMKPWKCELQGSQTAFLGFGSVRQRSQFYGRNKANALFGHNSATIDQI